MVVLIEGKYVIIRNQMLPQPESDFQQNPWFLDNFIRSYRKYLLQRNGFFCAGRCFAEIRAVEPNRMSATEKEGCGH
ncbi:MAG: hypothetical protein EA360_11440 [Balneolaceae bacterium]|nr:MAG: hypothetical protein EA360_11440 [Balneolaceae bacterium]